MDHRHESRPTVPTQPRSQISVYANTTACMGSDADAVALQQAAQPRKHVTTTFSGEHVVYHDACPTGEGGFGKVYPGLTASGSDVVVKVMDPAGTKSKQRNEDRQTAIAMELEGTDIVAQAQKRHPSLTQFTAPVQGFATEHNGRATIVLENMSGGSLEDLAMDPLTKPQERYKAMREMCMAVQAMHDVNLSHGDIKPANVMLDREGTAKLIDFGLVRKLDKHGYGISPVSNPNSAARTPSFFPCVCVPEKGIISPESHGVAADRYQVGRSIANAVLLAAVDDTYASSPKFGYADDERLVRLVSQHASPGLGKAIGKLLSENPDKRPGFQETMRELQALEHGRQPSVVASWMNRAADAWSSLRKSLSPKAKPHPALDSTLTTPS